MKFPCAVAVSVLICVAVPPPAAMAGSAAAARSQVNMAKESLDRGDFDRVDSSLESAEKYLDGLSDAEKAPILAEIKEVRAQVEPKKKAEQAKRVQEEIERHLRQAESDMNSSPGSAADVLKIARERLDSDDAKKYLPPETIQKLQARAKEVGSKLAMSNKKDALERAADPLKELEEKMAENPFKDADESEARSTYEDLDGLKKRVSGAIADLPKDDPDVKAINARLAAVDKKITAASAKWMSAIAQQEVARSWESVKDNIEGWSDETTEQKDIGTGGWDLPKTSNAVRQITTWLNDEDRKKLRADNKDNATVQATFAEAEKALAAAAEKMNDAFKKIMDDAEKKPTPTSRFDLEGPSTFAVNIDHAFEGTKYHDANVARVKKLDARWQAEVEAKRKGGEETYKKMSAEASAAWPKIESSLKPQSGFNPSDVDAWKGKTIVLHGVYNRAGWDFIDADFAARVNGMPVAGYYEPAIKAALSDAAHKTGMDIDDHAPWDLVAVVQGPARLRQRTSGTLKTKSDVEVAKLEGWLPVDAVGIKIIALRAGPVAVGAK